MTIYSHGILEKFSSLVQSYASCHVSWYEPLGILNDVIFIISLSITLVISNMYEGIPLCRAPSESSQPPRTAATLHSTHSAGEAAEAQRGSGLAPCHTLCEASWQERAACKDNRARTQGFGKADGKCLEGKVGPRRGMLAIQVEWGWGRDDSQGIEFWFKHK